jgi:hypothetical protein
MFWKCSFQRVYRRVSGNADSKGVSEWRVNRNSKCEMHRLREPKERSDLAIECLRYERRKKIAACKGGGKAGLGLILREKNTTDGITLSISI